MKAGALLLIPSMLGSIHLNHGTITLLVSVFLVVAYQVLLAAPFLEIFGGETSIRDYVWMSKLTGAGRDGNQGAGEFFNFVAATQGLSIFWTWMPEEFYYNFWGLGIFSKIAIPTVNAWFFFGTKNCLPECLDNLFNTFSKTPQGVVTHEQRRRTLQILIICHICGICFMPGGHAQFQFWFVCLMPIFYGMLGWPLHYYFWITPTLYPIKYPPMWQHFVLIACVLRIRIWGPADGKKKVDEEIKEKPKDDLKEKKDQ